MLHLWGSHRGHESVRLLPQAQEDWVVAASGGLVVLHGWGQGLRGLEALDGGLPAATSTTDPHHSAPTQASCAELLTCVQAWGVGATSFLWPRTLTGKQGVGFSGGSAGCELCHSLHVF